MESDKQNRNRISLHQANLVVKTQPYLVVLEEVKKYLLLFFYYDYLFTVAVKNVCMF